MSAAKIVAVVSPAMQGEGLWEWELVKRIPMPASICSEFSPAACSWLAAQGTNRLVGRSAEVVLAGNIEESAAAAQAAASAALGRVLRAG